MTSVHSYSHITLTLIHTHSHTHSLSHTHSHTHSHSNTSRLCLQELGWKSEQVWWNRFKCTSSSRWKWEGLWNHNCSSRMSTNEQCLCQSTRWLWSHLSSGWKRRKNLRLSWFWFWWCYGWLSRILNLQVVSLISMEKWFKWFEIISNDFCYRKRKAVSVLNYFSTQLFDCHSFRWIAIKRGLN